MISIVIPAYNEAEFIGRCLDHLIYQEGAEPFEVIIVDNASTDDTAAVAQSYANKINLQVVSESHKGRGAARHQGFSQATGEIILSSDADCAAPKNWVASLVSSLKDSGAVAVSGSFTMDGLTKPKYILFYTVQALAMRLYRLYFHHWWLNGTNFAIYKKVYDKSGGFDVRLNTQDDIDLSFKVAKLGVIVYKPSIKVITSSRRFDQGVFKGLQPYLKTFIQFHWRKNKAVTLDDPR